MITKNLLFIYSSIFFLLGVYINNTTEDASKSMIVLLILVVLFLWYYILTRKYHKILIISILWFIIWILISSYNIYKINLIENSLKQYFNWKNYEIVVEIDELNKINEYKKEYIAKLLKIGDIKNNETINVVLSLDKNYDLSKWDIIKTKTRFIIFEDFNDFSYKNYMLAKNLYFKSNVYNFDIVWKKEINIVEKRIIELRKFFLDTIYKIYPKEEAIFLWWILLWARESLPEELKQNFNNSWLTHFIAVSWFNITIIILFLTYIVRYLPTTLRVIIITLWIIFFTILVWDTAPVIRASIMGLIWYYILLSGRKWNILSIILLTLSIMVFISPYSLNYDVSLHLSFLAVIWIIYTQKFFEKVFFFLPDFLEIKTAFTLTLAAMTTTLPIMIFNFGQLSILSPLANIAVTWTIPIAMIFGFLSIIVYFVYPFAWIIVWYITWIFLKWDIMVVHFFWKMDFAIIKFDFWIYKNYIELLYFMIILFLIIWFRKKEEKI